MSQRVNLRFFAFFDICWIYVSLILQENLKKYPTQIEKKTCLVRIRRNEREKDRKKHLIVTFSYPDCYCVRDALCET